MSKQKKKKSINTVVLLFSMLVVIAILTHVIPSGEYTREVVEGRSCVVPGSYGLVEGRKISLFDIFQAIPNGFAKGVSLIFAFFAIGGAFEVLRSTGAIDIGISTMIKKVGIKHGNIILVVLFGIFSALGALLGMTDGAIPFIPVAISIALALGYDPLVALGVTTLGAYSGFLAGPLNPNSTAICQQIAGLPIYSGMGMRMLIWAVLSIVTLIYVMRYAKKTKKYPERSLMYGIEAEAEKFDVSVYENLEFTMTHKLSLLVLVGTLGFMIYGSIKLKWAFNQLSATFIIMSIIVAIIAKMDVDTFVKTFVKGASVMMSSALVISIAYGISWILNEAKVLDTIVYWISLPLVGLSKQLSIFAVSIAVSAINCLITSASGKAAVLMPIVLPLGDLVGLQAQVMILCYQFGDVVTNVLTPLSAFVMTCIGFAKVPYTKWIRFVAPLTFIWFVIGQLFMTLAVAMGYC